MDCSVFGKIEKLHFEQRANYSVIKIEVRRDPGDLLASTITIFPDNSSTDLVGLTKDMLLRLENARYEERKKEVG